VSDLLQSRYSVFAAQNYSGKDLKRFFLHPSLPLPKLLWSILEVANNTASKQADCGIQEYCCKSAVAISVQHGRIF
jgi:hypothetical protein